MNKEQIKTIFDAEGSHPWTDKEIDHVEFVTACITAGIIISLILILQWIF